VFVPIWSLVVDRRQIVLSWRSCAASTCLCTHGRQTGTRLRWNVFCRRAVMPRRTTVTMMMTREWCLDHSWHYAAVAGLIARQRASVAPVARNYTANQSIYKLSLRYTFCRGVISVNHWGVSVIFGGSQST